MRSLFLRAAPTPEPPNQTSAGVAITFLGTAGFTIAHGIHTIAIDPNLTRPSLLRTAFGRLTPDEALIAATIPQADAVLIGHSHHDHALDGPAVCRHTGAMLYGSQATAHLATAYGLPPAQMSIITPRVTVTHGDTFLTALPSRHGKALLGRVPLPGDILAPPPWPPRVFDLRHGPVYQWLVEFAGTRILHVDSADFIDEELVPADILCLCAVGRQYRKDYTRRVIELVQPKVVIPCHWDDFTVPLHANPRQLPGVDVEGFVDEIRAAGARAVVLGVMQTWQA